MPDARQQLFFDFVRLVSPAPENRSESPKQQPAPRETSRPTSNLSQPSIRGRVLDTALTRQCRELVADLGLDALAREVRVLWNSRLSTTAAVQASPKMKWLSRSSKLLCPDVISGLRTRARFALPARSASTAF